MSLLSNLNVPFSAITPDPTMRLPLAKARLRAERILDGLRPFCHRIEATGSLRRERETVGDLDFVVLPGNLRDFKARVAKHCAIEKDGEQVVSARMSDGFQLDFFIARHPERTLLATIPGNWGALMIYSTGSKNHNVWIAQRAARLGLHFNPFVGLERNGQIVAGETEEEIFKALETDFIDPKRRER